MVKFDLRETGGECHADVSGTPEQLVELIANIMINNEVCARLVLAASEVYHGEQNEDG